MPFSRGLKKYKTGVMTPVMVIQSPSPEVKWICQICRVNKQLRPDSIMDNMSWESVLFTVGNCALLNRVLLREQNKTLWKTSSTFLGLKGIAECWRAIIYWIMPSTQLLSHVRLFAAPWTIIACQAPMSMGFSRQEYWNGLPLPTPEDLLHPGVESTSLTSPPLAAGFFTTRATWKAQIIPRWLVKKKLLVFPQGANHVYKCN